MDYCSFEFVNLSLFCRVAENLLTGEGGTHSSLARSWGWFTVDILLCSCSISMYSQTWLWQMAWFLWTQKEPPTPAWRTPVLHWISRLVGWVTGTCAKRCLLLHFITDSNPAVWNSAKLISCFSACSIRTPNKPREVTFRTGAKPFHSSLCLCRPKMTPIWDKSQLMPPI